MSTTGKTFLLAVLLYFAPVISASSLTISEDNFNSYKEKQDRIFWTDQPVLTFGDFKADMKKDPMFSEDFSEDIVVLAKIRKTILVQKKTVGKMAKFKVYAAMIRDKSWIKTPNDTASLIHEQAHYDICEIYARMLRKELVKAKSMDEAKEMFNRISSQEMIEQNLFDAENSGSKDGLRPEWAEKIKRRLKEWEVYKNPVVIINLKG
jgi:hypothetical protein